MDCLKGITHCTFLCKDYDKMVRFYRDTLGLRQIFHTPLHASVREGLRQSRPEFDLALGEEWMTYLEIAPRNFVELFRLPYSGENDTVHTGFHHLCLLVEDIVEAARELEEKGVQLWDGPSWKGRPRQTPFPAEPAANPLGAYTFFINDPEGNQIEFMQYAPDSVLKFNP